jgi:hypothetical protein
MLAGAKWFLTLGMNSDRKRERDKLCWHATVANNYECDGSGSFCATSQSKSSYLKILRVRDWKINVQTKNSFQCDLKNSIHICLPNILLR